MSIDVNDDYDFTYRRGVQDESHPRCTAHEISENRVFIRRCVRDLGHSQPHSFGSWRPRERRGMNDNVVGNFFTAIAGLSSGDQVKALEWMRAAIDGGDFEQSMLRGINEGYFRIRFNAEGHAEFMLTDKGRDLALQMMRPKSEVPS